jgi:hypothetical protein
MSPKIIDNLGANSQKRSPALTQARRERSISSADHYGPGKEPPGTTFIRGSVAQAQIQNRDSQNSVPGTPDEIK